MKSSMSLCSFLGDKTLTNVTSLQTKKCHRNNHIFETESRFIYFLSFPEMYSRTQISKMRINNTYIILFACYSVINTIVPLGYSVLSFLQKRLLINNSIHIQIQNTEIQTILSCVLNIFLFTFYILF